MFVSDLPDELFDRIVCFATNDYRDLLVYGSVCRDWKEMVDRSIAWKTFDLSFRPRSLKDYDKSYVASLTVQSFRISDLKNLANIEYRKDVSQVVIHNTTGTEVNQEMVTKQSQGLQEEAREIRNRFMGVMKAYKSKWKQYHHFLFIRRLYRNHLDKFLLAGVISALVFASIAWWNFPSVFVECDHECIPAILDGQFRFFVSMYGLLGVFVIGCIGGMICNFAIKMISRTYAFGQEQITYRDFAQFLVPLLVVLGWWGSLGMLQSKLNQGWARELSYQAMIYPQWICNVVAYVLLACKFAKGLSEKVLFWSLLSGTVIAGLPLTFSMMASYHTESEPDAIKFCSNLYLAILPNFPSWILILWIPEVVCNGNHREIWKALVNKVLFHDPIFSYYSLLPRALVSTVHLFIINRMSNGMIRVMLCYIEHGSSNISPKDYCLPMGTLFFLFLLLAAAVLLKSRLDPFRQPPNEFA